MGFGTGDNCVGNAILSNSIYANGKIGIDLGSEGVPLLNSPGSPHTGPNLLQSFPVLTEAVAFTGFRRSSSARSIATRTRRSRSSSSPVRQPIHRDTVKARP